jgi:hypothetical protein
MSATTVCALLYLLFKRFIPQMNISLCIVSSLLLLFAFFMLWWGTKRIKESLKA